MSPPDVSDSCRVFLLLVGAIESLLFSGVLFGWANLVYLMKLEGVTSSMCYQNNGTYDCYKQDNFFGRAYVLSTFSKGIAFFLIGCLLENYGLRVSRIIAILQVSTGGLMIGYSTRRYPYLLYAGTLLVGFGGSHVRMNCFMVANYFPNHKSTILSCYNGAFCASASVFLVFKHIHQMGITVKTSFVIWSGLSFLMIVPTFLLPSKLTDDSEELEDNEVLPLKHASKESSSQGASEDNGNYRSVIPGTSSQPVNGYGTISDAESQAQSLRDKTPTKQSFCSLAYIAHLCWSCVSALLLAVYAGSFERWVETITNDSETVSKMMELYGYSQLLMIFIPLLCGFLLDYSLKQAKKETDPNLRRKKANLSRFWFLFVTTLAEIIQAVFMFFNTEYGVTLSLLVYIFTRPMINAATVVHLRISFPSDHFTNLLGLVGTLSSIFASGFQYPLFLWAATDQFSANMTVMVMVVLSLANPFVSLFQ